MSPLPGEHGDCQGQAQQHVERPDQLDPRVLDDGDQGLLPRTAVHSVFGFVLRFLLLRTLSAGSL